MAIHAMAGKPAPKELLVDVEKLQKEYYARKPDITDRAQRVSFGTSGHRGSSLRGAFNEAHVLAITQSICDYRKGQGIAGPLYIGKDTHALSDPALVTALEVLAANGVDVMIDRDDGYTPTPAVSHAILTYNRDRHRAWRTASSSLRRTIRRKTAASNTTRRNGGPADTESHGGSKKGPTNSSREPQGVTRMAYEQAHRAPTTHTYDYVGTYVNDLASVVDMDVIRNAGLKIGVDPLGGAGVAYWRPIAERTDPAGSSEQHGRPHVRLHVIGLGRQDPHGLLVALRHGEPDRAQRPLRYRLW